MPLFDFKCNECGHVHELFKKFSNADATEGTECPICGAPSTKQISSCHFRKGDGYWADERNNG